MEHKLRSVKVIETFPFWYSAVLLCVYELYFFYSFQHVSFSFQSVIHRVGSVWVRTPQTARSVSNRKWSCCLKMDMSLTGPVCLPAGHSITLTQTGPAEVSKQVLIFFSEYATILILSSSLIMKWWQDKRWKNKCACRCVEWRTAGCLH